MEEEPTVVTDGLVVSMDYTLRADDEEGEVLDTSVGQQPLQFMQGGGHIISGLERAIYGMAVGDEKDVVVEPADGYGEFDPEAFAEVPLNVFPEAMPVEPGVGLTVRDDSGHTYDAHVVEVREDSAVLDFNHPLAGQTLYFNVKIAGLRRPTDEERAHGHVHTGHDHD